jgi:hypothetical protein
MPQMLRNNLEGNIVWIESEIKKQEKDTINTYVGDQFLGDRANPSRAHANYKRKRTQLYWRITSNEN